MKKQFFLSVLLGLIAAIIVIVYGQEFVQEWVVLPLSYLSWFGKLIYRSFDQRVLWVSLVIVVILLAGLSLNRGHQHADEADDFGSSFLQRIQVWRQRLQAADRGAYLQWRLSRYLHDLLLEAIIYRTGFPREQILQGSNQAGLDLPEEILAYLIAGQQSESAPRQFLDAQPPQALNLDPDEIADFIEDYLDMV